MRAMRAAWLLAGAAPAVLAAACSKLAEEDPRDTCTSATCPPGSVAWVLRAESLTRSTVTAVAPSPGEPPWFAGGYSEDLRVDTADFTFPDPGPHDGFAGRVGARKLEGTWTARLGSPHALRAIGLVPDGEQGAIVVVAGEQSDGQTRVEAAWLDRTRPWAQEITRETLALMSAPGGLGAAAVAVDDHGWPLVALSGRDLSIDGAVTPGAAAQVYRMTQGLARELLLAVRDIEIADVAAGAGGTVVIGGRYAGTLPGWPPCAEPSCGFVAAVDGAGLRWVRPIRASGGASVRAVAAGPGGVVALAAAAGPPIDPVVGAAALPAYLVLLDDAGGDRTQVILAAEATTIAGGDLGVADDGAVFVGLSFRGTVQVGGMSMTSDATGDDLEGAIGELELAGTWRWSHRLHGDRSVRVETVAVAGEQLVVGGSYHTALALDGAPLLPAGIDGDNGFVLELVR